MESLGLSTTALAWICILAVAVAIIFCCWGNAIERDLQRRMQDRDRRQEGAGTDRREDA